MSTEVSNSETTGELTNASAARGPSPTLVVRRLDDEGQPEVPIMVLRSHSRGGRSSACVPEPSGQAGSHPTGNVNVGGRPTRQGKSTPEPEIHHDHTRQVATNQPEVYTASHTNPARVYTGSHIVHTEYERPKHYTGLTPVHQDEPPEPYTYVNLLSYRGIRIIELGETRSDTLSHYKPGDCFIIQE